ncbi:Growth/Differentiation Factor 5 [Manis pentadactyla]|nr:Growth/Differentiation Factor 5 [Manis pentadactyla]
MEEDAISESSAQDVHCQESSPLTCAETPCDAELCRISCHPVRFHGAFKIAGVLLTRLRAEHGALSPCSTSSRPEVCDSKVTNQRLGAGIWCLDLGDTESSKMNPKFTDTNYTTSFMSSAEPIKAYQKLRKLYFGVQSEKRKNSLPKLLHRHSISSFLMAVHSFFLALVSAGPLDTTKGSFSYPLQIHKIIISVKNGRNHTNEEINAWSYCISTNIEYQTWEILSGIPVAIAGVEGEIPIPSAPGGGGAALVKLSSCYVNITDWHIVNSMFKKHVSCMVIATVYE